MPSEFVDETRLSSSVYLPSAPSSFFSEENQLPTQRQVGFRKPESVPDHNGIGGMQLMSGSKSVSSSPLERVHVSGGNPVILPEISQPFYMKDHKNQLSIGHRAVGVEREVGLSNSWRPANQNPIYQANPSLQTVSLDNEGDAVNLKKPDFENSLFSSSLSDIFDKKMKLSSRDSPFGQSSMLSYNFEDDEPFESLKEVEAQTIGNLLPDDDDLLSGVVNDIGFVTHKRNEEDIDDDLFCSGGGMELEIEGNKSSGKISDYKGRIYEGRLGERNSSLTNGHIFSEHHPSRTLIIRSVHDNIEENELRALFEQYGDIDRLHTTFKAHAFILVSYYDIRAAQNAMQTLQKTSLGHHELDIQFYFSKDNDDNEGWLMLLDLDPCMSYDDLLRMFGIYGDVKEISESLHDHYHKFVEFYDVRATEAALNSLNGMDIAGKKIKVKKCPGGTKHRRLMRQISSDVKQGYSRPEGYASIPLGRVSSSGAENGAVDLHSALQAAIRPMREAPFHSISSSELHSLSSPIRVASVCSHNNRSSHVDASHSVGQLNFGLQGVQPPHPHSLPEYHDGLISGIPFNSSSGVAGVLPASISSRTTDVMEHRHIHMPVSDGFNSHALEHHESAFGVSGTGTCAIHGQKFVWNCSSSYPNRPAASMIWPNSPSFINAIIGHPTPQQIHGLPRNPSHMLNAILPLHHHHVGSAPAVNPSLWDRRHYPGDSGFYVGSLGSLGSNGIPGGSNINPLEYASRNMLHRNCIDAAISSPVGMPSRNMLNGRNGIIPMPSSYDAPSERIRSRRSDGSSNLADNNKQFELDIERISRSEDSRTTLMIKNIPNKYTSKMLLAAIDEHHRGTYDFIYLPIDFKNKCNVGYAFINMVNPQQIIPFYQTFNGKKWEKFNSEKVASLAYARIQGKQALIAHFQNSSLMNEDKRCRPILFCTEGPNAGDQEPFPVGVNIRSRPGRPRTNNNEDNHPEAPSLATSVADPSGTSGSINESES